VVQALTMQPLGMSPEDERMYRLLLRMPGAPGIDLARVLGEPVDAVSTLLAALARRGLVKSQGGAGAGWMATAPEVAVELLLMERQVELNHARLILPELQQELRQLDHSAHDDDVQVIPGDPASHLHAYLQMQRSACQDMAFVVCPPFSVSAPDLMETARAQARQRGVRFRTIVAPEAMLLPGWEACIAQMAATGEQVRILAEPPLKMILTDRSSGLLPLRANAPAGPLLRVGPTAMLDALWLLFETLWDRAVPFQSQESLATDAGAASLDKDLQAVLTLMAAGSNDKTVADLLGMSERTLLRRINAMSGVLRAKSRFHLGWLAALRWGTPRD
jgi:hypothetical protein